MNDAPKIDPALEAGMRAYALATAQSYIVRGIIKAMARKDVSSLAVILDEIDVRAAEYTDSALGGRSFGAYEREASRLVVGHLEDMQKALRETIEKALAG